MTKILIVTDIESFALDPQYYGYVSMEIPDDEVPTLCRQARQSGNAVIIYPDSE